MVLKTIGNGGYFPEEPEEVLLPKKKKQPPKLPGWTFRDLVWDEEGNVANFIADSPTGRTYFKNEFDQLDLTKPEAGQDVGGAFLKPALQRKLQAGEPIEPIAQALLRLYPDVFTPDTTPDIGAVKQWATEQPDEFLQDLKTKSPKDATVVLRSLGADEPTIREIGDSLGIQFVRPEWTTIDFWKDVFFRPYGGKDLKGKAAASFVAGIGDVFTTTGGAARWLGYEEAGRVLSTIGTQLRKVAPTDTTGEFEVADLLNPEFYATKIVRTIPFSLSLLPLAIGGYGGGAAVATAVGLGRIGSAIVGGLAGAALSRPLESAMEAGGAYDDAIARGKTEAEAKKEADEVFKKNMTLAGADAFEIAIALAPTPKWVPSSLVKAGLVRTARIGGKMVIVGLSEGGEEMYQDMITRRARGEEWKLDPVSKEVFAIGAVMGLGMGLGGDLVSGIVDRAQTKMSGSLKARFNKSVSDFKAEGFTTEQAELKALDVIAATPEGEKVVNESIKEVSQEAKIPFMITNQQEAQLKAKGYTQEAINKMTPQEANDILAKAIPAKPVTPVPTPTTGAVVKPAVPEKVTPEVTIKSTYPLLHKDIPVSESELNSIVNDIQKLYPEADGVSVVGTFARTGEIPTAKSHDVDLLIHFPEGTNRRVIEARVDTELWHKWGTKRTKNIDFLRKFGAEEPGYGEHLRRLEEKLPTPEIKVWSKVAIPKEGKIIPKKGITPVTPEVTKAKYKDYQEIHNAVKKGELKIGDKTTVSAYGGQTVEIVPPEYAGELDQMGLPLKYRIKEVAIPKAEAVTPEVTKPLEYRAEQFSKGLKAGSQFEGGEVPANIEYSWRSMGQKEYERIIVEGTEAGVAQRGRYWSWFPAYSSNLEGTVKSPKYLVEVNITSKGETLTRATTPDDITGIWRSEGKGWVRVERPQIPKAEVGMPEAVKYPATQAGAEARAKAEGIPISEASRLNAEEALVAVPVEEVAPKEIFPGITAVEPMPEVIAEEVVPPTIPPVQPPQTVDIPEVPPTPDARNRIIKQSDEVVKQSLPGAFNRLIQKIPGIKQAMRFERPALVAFSEKNQHLVVAQVVEVAARSDVAARQVATRLPLFKQLHDVFGEKVLRGEKSDIEFIGTEEQKAHALTGTLLDIAQNPELYKLTPTQKGALQAINTHNDASLDYVVNQYGAEIGRFAPKPDGAFLSNVDIDEGIIDWLGSETRAIAQGRGKTRYWQTARDRMNADKTFKPEMDIKRLIDGMDSFKSSAAGGVSFREAVGGKTRLEAIQETHPKLYDRMITLRKTLQKWQGYKRILTEQQLTAIDDFLSSAHEEVDITALDDAFFLQAGRYVAKARAGEMLMTIEQEIQSVKDEIRALKPAWKVANLKPYVFVQEGLYRYFPAEQAKYIIQSRKTTSNPTLNFIERWRGQAFSGDFSPFAIQGSIGVLADPLGSLQATGGGIKAAFENRDFTHSFTVDGLIDDINSDIEGWAEFASLMGRTLTGTPREYAAGFLSSIPGFDKFTETTYITVTRGTKNLYDRTWQGLVKSGVPILEAKVAAIEQAQKVYPLVNPAKLGQSQARAAVLRAIPTSYSFIRQPITLIGQASMGFAKTATFQKTTPQERIAMRIIATMAASILVVSATSAAISKKAQGGDDDEVWQAVLDAINPDPNNGKFASIIIGDFRIPLGGPYRSIFRAIYPQEVKGIPFPVPFAGIPNFVFNRITPAIKTQINLLRNKDYYGKQIVKGQFPENIIRALLYEVEGALPLSAGELLGGVRREEFAEEIWQQVAAQFVGVNLIKLDNTYFHKLVRNLGLPTQEAPSPYSLESPNFTYDKFAGKIISVLSDVTLEEVERRKGYPSLVAGVIEARDLKREVDLLPNYSPVSLNADPAQDKGLTYKTLYQQWTDRQGLVLAGEDAEYTTQELVGGRYKTRAYKGEDALKAFDKENPQAEKGNISQRQFALLNEYWAITDKKKQAEFLKEHPEISVNPRIDYLKTHPKENALLTLTFGADTAKLLTKEAYNEFKKFIKKLDIPDSAIPELTLPPEGSIDNYFKYQDMENKNSWESQLMLAKDPDLLKFLGRQPIDTPIASLELKVKNRANFDTISSYSDKDSPDYIADEKKRAEAIKKFKTDNPEFVDDTRRIEAIEKGTEKVPTPDNIIKNYVEYGNLIDKEGVGSSSAEAMLYRVDNPEYDKWRTDANIWGDSALKPVDQSKIPIWRIDVKYAKQDTEYDALPTTGTVRDDYLAKNEAYRLDRRRRQAYEKGLTTQVENYVSYYELPIKGYRQERFLFNNPDFAQAVGLKAPDRVPSEEYDNLLEKEDKTPEDDLRMDAYKMYVPDDQIEDYVGYKTIPKGVYEDDWFLMEHPDFYQQVYLGILGKERKDYRKVPTREVYAKYQEYLNLSSRMRENYRFDNPDLEDWLILTGKVTARVSEARRRATLTPSQRLAEEVAERIRRIRGLGEPVPIK